MWKTPPLLSWKIRIQAKLPQLVNALVLPKCIFISLIWAASRLPAAFSGVGTCPQCLPTWLRRTLQGCCGFYEKKLFCRIFHPKCISHNRYLTRQFKFIFHYLTCPNIGVQWHFTCFCSSLLIGNFYPRLSHRIFLFIFKRNLPFQFIDF